MSSVNQPCTVVMIVQSGGSDKSWPVQRSERRMVFYRAKSSGSDKSWPVQRSERTMVFYRAGQHVIHKSTMYSRYDCTVQRLRQELGCITIGENDGILQGEATCHQQINVI